MTFLRSLSGLCAALIMMAGAAAQPPASPVTLDIKPQPLDDAINLFARQAGLQVVFYSGVGKNITSPRVVGTFVPSAALERLLANTSLAYEFIDDRTIAIVTKPVMRESSTTGTGPASPATASQAQGALQLAQTQNQEAGRVTQSSEQTKLPGAVKSSAADEIEVTGSSIRGVGPVGSSSVSISREELDRAGYSTIEQFLATLPQNFAGGAAGSGPDGHLGNGVARGANYTAASGINLRGLGSTSTLVLVNGHRLSATGDGYLTDISTIPESAIERIEIVTDGASAVYGSDAVAGVVNFILRTGFDGADTRVKYGYATQGGYSERRLGQSVGRTWSGGGASITGEYMQQSRLPVDERAVTSNIPMPADIYPPTQRLSLVSAGEQQLGNATQLKFDIQYSNKAGERRRANNATQYRAVKYNADKWGGSGSLLYDLSDSWRLRASAAYGLESADFTTKDLNNNGTMPLFQDATADQELTTYDLGADGDLFTLPGGDIRMAAGAGLRTERWHRDGNQVSNGTSSIINVGARRTVHSAYGELYVPLFSGSNARTALRRLEMSAALRYDDYSDFGSTHNVRVGVNWSPVESVAVRASYSESFRAASIGAERYTGDIGTLVVQYQYVNAPTGGFVPILYLVGGDALDPETATSYGLGITVTPPALPGLEVKLDYFSVDYRNRIGLIAFGRDVLTAPQYAPLVTQYSDASAIRALVDAYRAQGATIIDSTLGQFGADPVGQMRQVFDGRTQNLAQLDVDGLDFTVRYAFKAGRSTFGTQMTVSYLGKYDTKISETAPSADFIDVYGYPPDLSANASVWMNSGPFSATLTGTYRDDYRLQIAANSQKLSSFFTANLSLAYQFAGMGDSSLRLSAINVLDRDPPFLPTTPTGANYDPAVANPLGRMLSLEFVKKW